MSVYAYTGLPGSGKSYAVVDHQIIPALKAGRTVVTNVALKFDKLRELYPEAKLIEFPTAKVSGDPSCIYDYVVPGSVFVLDEVWKMFPAGLKANHVPETFRSLLAEHRHMVDAENNSCQIVLVTQDLAQISAFARQLVEQTFRSIKLTSVGMNKQFRVDVYNGAAVGPNPPQNARIRQIFGQFGPPTWDYYETHTKRQDFGSTAKVNERSVDKRANVLRRPVVFIGALAVVGLLGFGFSSLNGIYKDYSEPELVSAGSADPPETSLGESSRGPLARASAKTAPRNPQASVSQVKGELVGFIEHLEDPSKSVALVKIGNRVLPRPLSYCSKSTGWWICNFPDLGKIFL